MGKSHQPLFFTNKNIAFELTPQGKFETKDDVIDFLDVIIY